MPAGALDPTFSGDGILPINPPYSIGRMLATASNGLYAVVGQGGGAHPARLERYTASGAPDATFGSGGAAYATLGLGGSEYATALAYDGSNMLMAIIDSTNDRDGVARVLSTGQVDTSFGSGGHVLVPLPAAGLTSGITDVHALPDGRVEIAIIATQFFSPDAGYVAMERLLPNGTPDTSLGPNGVKVLMTFAASHAATAEFAPNGQLYFHNPTPPGHALLARFTTTGALDRTFSGDGVIALVCPDAADVSGMQLVVDGAGRAIAECTINVVNDLYFTRFTTTGALDTTFGTSGTLRVVTNANDENQIEWATDRSSRLVIAWIDAFTSDDLQLRRYRVTGVADPTFGTAGAATITESNTYELGPLGFARTRVYVMLGPNSVPTGELLAVYAGAKPPGTTTAGVTRTNGAALHWYTTNTNTSTAQSFDFQLATDTPVVGDWDGNGTFTAGVVRTVGNSLSWYLTNDDVHVARSFVFGASGARPVVGDWNGDGTTTVGVAHPVAGALRWDLSNDFATVATSVDYGISTDTPVPGDWDGNGTTTIGVTRSVAGALQWFLSNAVPTTAIRATYGMATDTPIAGDWNGDGVSTIGVARAQSSARYWYLTDRFGVPSNPTFIYGRSTDRVVAGNWDAEP